MDSESILPRSHEGLAGEVVGKHLRGVWRAMRIIIIKVSAFLCAPHQSAQ